KPGRGYNPSTPPKVTFDLPTSPVGTQATGTAGVNAFGEITAVTITDPGSGYNTTIGQAGVTIGPPTGTPVTESATLTVTGATISNNYAGGVGGGIGNAGNGAVTITDSTLSGNQSLSSGGGFGDENAVGTLTVRNSIFAGNLAATTGGGI